jgi:ATP-dependent Clp protease protease subunit
MDLEFKQYGLRAQRLEDEDEDEERGKKPKKDKEPKSRLEEKFLETRTILLFGEINQKVAREVCEKLILLAAINDNDIKVIINSQGGHVEAGDTIHDMLTFVKPKVKILGTGWVASAGALIFVAVPTENRYSLPNTRFMLHQPSGGVGGQASDISIEAQEILKMRDRLNKIFSVQTGQPVDRIEKDTDRNFWMSADEAKAYGLVGKVITSQADF